MITRATTRYIAEVCRSWSSIKSGLTGVFRLRLYKARVTLAPTKATTKAKARLSLLAFALASSAVYATDTTQESHGGDSSFEYNYVPLTDKTNIRLLHLKKPINKEDTEIRATLQEVKLAEAPDYVALSYTWALPDRVQYDDLGPKGKVSTIDVNFYQFTIWQNLYNALHHIQRIRGFEEVYLWIDAVCIDQSNDAEKTAQVARIGDIFRSANRVLVWLGADEKRDGSLIKRLINDMDDASTDLTNNGSRTFRTSEDLRDENLLQRYGLTMQSTVDWLSLGMFFSNRWFRRVWTAQEVILAKDIDKVLVLYGHRFFDWVSIVNAEQMMRKIGLNTALNELVAECFHRRLVGQGPVGSEVFGLQTVYQMLDPEVAPAWLNSMGVWAGQRSHEFNGYSFLMVMLTLLPNREATDPRDRIFGSLGLVNRFCEVRGLRPISLQADYTKSVDVVFEEAVRHIAKATDCSTQEVREILYRVDEDW